MSAASEPLVVCHVDGGVAHIVLNRPAHANAISTPFAIALAEAIGVAVRADVGAILLSARGRHFCVGGDIEEFVGDRARLDAVVQGMVDVLHPAMQSLVERAVPVVSAVQGPIGGAGIALALCADFVLASPAMKLRGGYSAIGLSPDLGASFFLTRRAGAARAKRILMTNAVVPAQQCLEWGLVDALHAGDALWPEACALAAQLADGARESLGGIRRLCDGAHEHDLGTHLGLEREALLRAARSADGREGITAFVEKRAPVFGAR